MTKRVWVCEYTHAVLIPWGLGRPQKDTFGCCSPNRGLFGTLSLWVLVGKWLQPLPTPKHCKGQEHNLLGLIS